VVRLQAIFEGGRLVLFLKPRLSYMKCISSLCLLLFVSTRTLGDIADGYLIRKAETLNYTVLASYNFYNDWKQMIHVFRDVISYGLLNTFRSFEES